MKHQNAKSNNTPIPKPRTSISKPTPKPRSKISLIEDIEDIPPPPEFVGNNEEFEYNELPEIDNTIYNVDKDGELIDFNLKDLFEPIEVMRLEDELKTDMCNIVERYLSVIVLILVVC